MGEHRAPVTPDEAAHPLTRCLHCGAQQTDARRLDRVSVKKPDVDDYHHECAGSCEGLD